MVSIIICTYNRAEILNLCLDRIVQHGEIYKNIIEVLVINNNSSDNTQEVVFEHQSKSEIKIDHIFEKIQGLSAARNTGAKHAKFEWLFYLDDDGLIVEDTLDQLFETINNYNFDIFGGIYKSYFLEEKPKWISNDFGNKNHTAEIIQELKTDKIEGGIMVLKKSAFNNIGGFNTEKGMIGNKIRYSEESDFIKRSKKFNYKLGINPFFKMEHIVGKHKFNIFWHFKAQFSLARDKTLLGESTNLSKIYTLITLPIRIVKYFLYYIVKKDFYFENFLWCSFNNTIYIIGIFYGNLLRLLHESK